MKKNLIGIDIGGTKCAVTYGIQTGDTLEIIEKVKFATSNVTETVESLGRETGTMLDRHGLSAADTAAIGISCGGPLDTKHGIVMSPPNLPGWDNIPVVDLIGGRFGIRTAVQNDANAGALAEWKFGAGRGCDDLVFLTFGTGLGAGLILNGRLYDGVNGNAGEAGHIRLADFGPVGYGKQGSFEGFCSGGGIAQLARTMATEQLQMGRSVSFCRTLRDLPAITAQSVAEAAWRGDALAAEVYALAGRQLGRGLSMLIDLLNPGRIILGGIFMRAAALLEPHMNAVIRAEALPAASTACRIVPAGLGEQIGDYAALSVAANLAACQQPTD